MNAQAALATMDAAHEAEVQTLGQWSWWQLALSGIRGDFDKNDPPSGYYRNQDRSLALWRDDNGNLQWQVSSGFNPHRLDELCDAFGSFCVRPISYEVWEAHRDTGRWPEDVSGDIAAVQQDEPREATTTPDAQIIVETSNTLAAFDKWLSSIGGKIGSEEHDAKADAFQKTLLALAKRRQDGFDAEKEPHRRAGQEIDARWNVPKDLIVKAKDRISAVVTPYRVERKRKADEAERLAREEAKRAKAEAAAKGESPPIPQTPRKAASGLRQVEVTVITDLDALVPWLLKNNAARGEIENAVRPIAKRLIKASIAVPGAEIQIQHKA